MEIFWSMSFNRYSLYDYVCVLCAQTATVLVEQFLSVYQIQQRLTTSTGALEPSFHLAVHFCKYLPILYNGKMCSYSYTYSVA